jgi:hypothetical protein
MNIPMEEERPFSEAEEDDRPVDIVDDFLDDSDDGEGEDLFGDGVERYMDLMQGLSRE